MRHDYKRHGTTTLFAALSVLDGTVIARCMQHQSPRIHPFSQCRRELLFEDDAAAHPPRIFRSIADLQAAINTYLAQHNASPKPFVWTQSAEAIVAKLDRCPVPSV